MNHDKAPQQRQPTRSKRLRQAPKSRTAASLSRAEIIRALSNELGKLDFIQAFWEGGASAWGRVDEYSDIDAYLLVDDGKIQETFNAVENTLLMLSPIKQKYVIRQNPWPGLSQAFYRLKNANEFLVLDLGILTSSTPDRFLEPAIHGTSIFYFNKSEIDQTPSTDMRTFERKSWENVQAMIDRFKMFSNFVEKEIRRGNSLEALEYYRTIVIPSLTQALRLKYSPMHYDFRMRYIHYDLPKEIVRRLETLSFVRDMKDLERKYPKAVQWFYELVADEPHGHLGNGSDQKILGQKAQGSNKRS